MQPLHVVVVFNKSLRQVIEEGFVTRRVGERQIIGRFDDATVKVVRPDPVD